LPLSDHQEEKVTQDSIPYCEEQSSDSPEGPGPSGCLIIEEYVVEAGPECLTAASIFLGTYPFSFFAAIIIFEAAQAMALLLLAWLF